MKSIREAFLRYVKICEHGYLCDVCCWEWKGNLQSNGYGRLKFNGKYHKAHRVSFALHNRIRLNSFPELLVCHTCDNPPCINYNHLFLGTNKDNSEDMVRKGRQAHPSGSKHPQSVLSELQIQEIRNLFALHNISQDELSQKYKTTKIHILKILRKDRWKHLNDNLQEIINKKLNDFRTERDWQKGSNNPNFSGITSQEVLEMRKLKKLGWSDKSLANKFSQTVRNVQNIVHYRTWKHIV